MTREEIKELLEVEIKNCKANLDKAVNLAKEGKMTAAINRMDIAVMAKNCALQRHAQLWNTTKGNVTEEEFELLAEAETLNSLIRKAEKTRRQYR
ncbi:transcriptional regulator [uncultured Anaerococcus sp.]|uniref:transcriptional regulator n=1 Tax=uncultured Anaerococcus sp. TaxID=293428 RepID=UPI00288C0A20|nr:transcriptional regulator [uncultured Anaerococcus sp.]